MAANMEKLSKPFSSWWDKSAFMGFFESLIGMMADTRSESEKLSAAFFEQKNEVQQLDGKLTPLIQRHDELKRKANLNKAEQVELKKAISGIAEIMPTAVTQWDKYGNAISINTDKAREYIAVQKALLANQNKDAIAEAREELNKMGKERFRLIRSMNNAKETTGYEMGEKVTAAFVARIKFLTQEMKARETLLKGLRGDMLDVPEGKKTTDTVDEVVTPYSIPTKEEESAKEKAAKIFQKLKDDIDAWKNKAEKGEDGADKALVDIENQYKELLARAVGHEEETKMIKENYSTLTGQRRAEIDKEFDEQSRKRAFTNLSLVYDEEEARLSEHLQDRLIELELSDKTEIEKAAAKAGLLAEYEVNTFNAKQERLIAEAILIDAHLNLGNLEVKEQEQLAQRKIALEKQVADNAIAEAERTASRIRDINDERVTSQQNLELAIRDAVGEGFSLMNSLFKENSAAAKIFFALEKVAAGAKVMLMLQQELAAIRVATALQIAWANSNPLTMGMVPVIKANGIASSLTAKINAGIGMAAIATQTITGFAKGGFTELAQSNNPGGPVTVPAIFNGRYIAGEAGKEWIAPNWMVNSPATANILGALEALRLKGPGSVSEFASVGSQQTGYDFSRMENLFQQMIKAQLLANNKKVILETRLLDEMREEQIMIANDLNA